MSDRTPPVGPEPSTGPDQEVAEPEATESSTSGSVTAEPTWDDVVDRVRRLLLGVDGTGRSRRPTAPRAVLRLGVLVAGLGAAMWCLAMLSGVELLIIPLLMGIGVYAWRVARRSGIAAAAELLLGPPLTSTAVSRRHPLLAYVPRLVGPGSVPLAAALLLLQTVQLQREYLVVGWAGAGLDRYLDVPFLAGVAAASSVVVAGHRALGAWALNLGAMIVTAYTVEPSMEDGLWPWTLALLLSHVVVLYAVARGAPGWTVPLAWLAGLMVSTVVSELALPDMYRLGGEVASVLYLHGLLSAAAAAAGGLPRLWRWLRGVLRSRATRPRGRGRWSRWETVLLGPRDVGRSQRLIGPWLLLRLILPGSVPLALVLFVTEVLLLATGGGLSGDLIPFFSTLVVVLVQAGTVVLAAYRPPLAWGVGLVAFLLVGFLTMPRFASDLWSGQVPALLGHLVVLYAVGRWSRLRMSVVAVVIAAVVTFVAEKLLYVPQTLVALAGTSTVLVSALGAAAALIGFTVQIRQRAQSRIVQGERLSAEERARREMLEDRAKIARELHDVVAHHMSVIAVQSSTAAYRLDDLSEETRREFDAIGESARESLTEMRRLLGVLRADGSRAERAPQPTLDRLEQLVEATRRAGTPVELVVDELPERMPASVDLTAYRVVQEGLSNVVRHAPGASARVELRATSAELTVAVRNDRPERRPGYGVLEAGGHGLVGMRERIGALGGRLDVGPTEDEGFAITAWLPLDDPSAAPDGPGREDRSPAGDAENREEDA